MHDQNLAADAVRQWQRTEHLREQRKCLPCKLCCDLTREAVDTIHVERFVIATVEVDRQRVHHQICKQGYDHFNRPRAAVHEVAVEQIRVLGAPATRRGNATQPPHAQR